jgi:hypothetical protein
MCLLSRWMSAKLLNPMAGDPHQNMKNPTKTSEAVAWITSGPGRTQAQAALLYGVSQSAVSQGLAAWRKANPGAAPVDARRKQRSPKT